MLMVFLINDELEWMDETDCDVIEIPKMKYSTENAPIIELAPTWKDIFSNIFFHIFILLYYFYRTVLCILSITASLLFSYLSTHIRVLLCKKIYSQILLNCNYLFSF